MGSRTMKIQVKNHLLEKGLIFQPLPARPAAWPAFSGTLSRTDVGPKLQAKAVPVVDFEPWLWKWVGGVKLVDFSGIPWNSGWEVPQNDVFFRKVREVCAPNPPQKCRFRKLQVIYPGFLMGFEIQRTVFLVVMSLVNVVSLLWFIQRTGYGWFMELCMWVDMSWLFRI